MKKFISEFVKRGFMAAWGGPVVLAVVYRMLGANGTLTALSADTVFIGVITSTLLAFIAGGISAIYTVERMHLMWKTLIQCAVLYADYITIYLINGWIKPAAIPGFTLIFAIIYVVIWVIVWLCTRSSVRRINEKINR